MEVETTRLDAGTGLLLINKGNYKFEALTSKETGFYIPQDVKSIKIIRQTADGKPRILVGANNAKLRVFQINGSIYKK
ncbi:hypothetical protein JL193_03925 [Polaribacter batillariae]|uniref:Uncharacterized protein n=1 Tax=Polaribacter batillariae TaxID=2808900 RepID=A0ABX7SW21_9FLAO|nr:hypothetical protein [Polaribacter batillariae]QTD38450.1 hypothetical protein JL193_03925 [Polaribacter batillariae]